MEIIIGVGFVVFLGFMLSKMNGQPQLSAKSEESEEAQRQAWLEEFRLEEGIREAEDARIDAILKCTVEKHAKILNRKYKQLVQRDEYGVLNNMPFFREARHFAERVCPPEVMKHYNEIYGEDGKEAVDIMIGARVSIILYEMESATEGSDGDPLLIYAADMSGVEYEQLVAARLRALGATVRTTAMTGDQGADIIAEIQGRFIAIQCKRSKRPVGNKAVQEAAAGLHFHGATEAWVVSDASFTPSARQLASTLGVALLHHDDVVSHLEVVGG